MFQNPRELHLKEEAVQASERTEFIVITMTNQLMVFKWRRSLITVRIVQNTIHRPYGNKVGFLMLQQVVCEPIAVL
jgi:hypothetical protein